MIKLTAIGHLGKDAITNNVNGKNVINFSVAHTNKSKDAQGVLKEQTIWVECNYWTDSVAVAPYLKKGTLVYVEGSPSVRSYTNNAGQPGASLNLRVNSVQLLGGKPTEQTGSSPNNSEMNNTADDSETMDDLPF